MFIKFLKNAFTGEIYPKRHYFSEIHFWGFKCQLLNWVLLFFYKLDLIYTHELYVQQNIGTTYIYILYNVWVINLTGRLTCQYVIKLHLNIYDKCS